MPDITMCSGDGCPIKANCYRYKAKPSRYRSYFTEVPWNEDVDACAYWWGDAKPEGQGEGTA